MTEVQWTVSNVNKLNYQLKVRDCQTGIKTKPALYYIQTKRCKTQWLRKAEIKRVDKGYQAKAKKGKAEAAY